MHDAAQPLPNPRQQWLILLACGVLYLAQSLQSWGWPALDGYPAIERWLDPQFLTADFYTNTTAKFGVDTPQAVFIGTLSRLVGVDYAVLLAGLTALRHLFWPMVLYGFLAALGRDRLIALLAVVLGTLGSFTLPRTLGWAWLWGDASTAMFAVFAAVLAWTWLLQRRAAPALAAMTVAALLQPLVMVHAGIMMLLIFAVDFDAAERRALLLRPVNIVLALALLAVFGAQYHLLAPQGARLPLADYALILVHERHPGDFLVSRFDSGGVRAFALGAVAVLIMALRCRALLPRPRLLFAVFAVYAAICVAGFVFVEIWPVRVVIDLIPFRTVIIIAPLVLLIIGVSAADQLRRRNWLALGLLVLAFVAAGPLAAHLGSGDGKAALLLLLAALAGLLPIRGHALPAWSWAVVAPALLMLAVPVAWLRRDALAVPTSTTSHAVYGWASAATPVQSRFLIEQVSTGIAYAKALSPQHMRLLGRRAVVASRDYPFAETDLGPWYRTWVIGLDHGRRDSIENATLADLAAICATLPYDFVVRKTPLPGLVPVKTFAPQHGIGTIFVYRPCGGPD